MSNGRSALPPCDLVMKGGVTSGIVYPPALQELARKYRFRQIGGTSAGAIAAACAAAAEHGSESGKPGAGFDGLGKISEWLGTGTNLLDLFQPSQRTRPLFKTVLALMGKNRQRARAGFPVLVLRVIGRLTVALLRYDLLGFLIGAVCGAVVAVLLRWLTISGSGSFQLVPSPGWPLAWAIVGLIFCAWVGGMIAGVIGLVRIVAEKVPANFFGMCNGRADNPASDATPVLTDWLHETLQRLAGLDEDGEPLTFGMLAAKDVRLSMITSNLSEAQPYDLPFGQNVWIFHEDEMRRLFPEKVARHLVQKAHRGKGVSLDKLPQYHFLPDCNDLPVVVAMRMSLSFPILISAVPLWGIHGEAYKTRKQDGVVVLQDSADLERHWFSDGGISSNFPIHFFDAWLPICPTFGINLRSMPPEKARRHVLDLTEAAKPDSPKTASALDGMVFLPAANAPQHPENQPLPNLVDFLGAIWNTAQNYRDNMQTLLPSYRERIVNIRMADDEGGLNLAMDPKVVQAVQNKGAVAGNMLREKFDMQTHQWVRFLVLMSELEQQLKTLQIALASESYETMLEQNTPNGDIRPPLPYKRSGEWRAEAKKRVCEILKMMETWKGFDDEWLVHHPGWGDECFFPYEAPKPDPVLKVAPKL